jgi:two-component system, NarL family, nitrate/nitrite response regulator NarL
MLSHPKLTSGSSANAVSLQPLQVVVLDRNRMSSQILADSLTKSHRFKSVAMASTSEMLAAIGSNMQQIAVISSELESGKSLGLQFARTVNVRYPELKIVILLDLAGRDSVIEAFRSGARGVFCRSEPFDDFLRCIEQISRGEIWAGKAESDFLLKALKSIPAPHISSAYGDVPLSKRELQVVQYAARGYTNKVIADKLGLSEHTVKNYLFRSFEKLGVSSRVELLFFLTVEGHNSQDIIENIESEPSLDNYCRIAEKGFKAANLVLEKIGKERGWGPHKTESDAYLWLRLVESCGEQVAARSHVLLEHLRSTLHISRLQELEVEVGEALRDFSTGAASLGRKLIADGENSWCHSKTA